VQLRHGFVGRFSQRVLVRAHDVAFAFDAHVLFPVDEGGSMTTCHNAAAHQ
jgi:hypothetical protein